MRRAIELAGNGLGSVAPNPMVGCVIVQEELIIGEGWHRAYGKPHAEVNAVESVENPAHLVGSTVYVTLEPCSHFGKTPPCSDLLIRHQVGRVVISSTDSNELVSGKGIAKLKAAGIKVEVGLMEAESRAMNRRFFVYHEYQRPYVILKWAQTADGFMARSNYDSKWISNAYSRQLVHRWRSEEDAILVGFNTAKYDNPMLNVRDWEGRDPLRIAIDPKLALDPSWHLFDGTQRTIIFNHDQERTEQKVNYIRIDPKDEITDIMKHLRHQEVQSLIVEGGAKTLERFIRSNAWDEARVFESENNFGSGIMAPVLTGLKERTPVMGDTLSFYVNRKAHG